MSERKGRFCIAFIDADAEKEYRMLDGSQRKLVDAGLARLCERADEIGKPLMGPLTQCKELKFRNAGLRIVFRIVGETVEVLDIVQVVAIGRRDKDKVFRTAEKRLRFPFLCCAT